MLEYTNGGYLGRRRISLLLPKLARGWTRRIVAYAQFLIGSVHVGRDGRRVLPSRKARRLIVTNVTIVIPCEHLFTDDGIGGHRAVSCGG